MSGNELTQELVVELQKAIAGEVLVDRLNRQLYSTDASNYRIVPAGVVIPRSADDVAAAVEIANRAQVSLVPRGGGSSLAGQTVGPGLVVDYSRYMDAILAINPEEGWVRVEPGITLEGLNTALLPYGLMVGPDPASAVVATLGGMVGNNSTGSHSIKYGMMVDHVREVEVVLSDGSRACLGPQPAGAIATLAQQSTLLGRLYREVPHLLEQYREDIAAGYPRTWRNVAGYTLNRLASDGAAGRPLNLASLLVGSEGTLAQVTSVTVGVVPRPALTRLAILHFDDLRRTLETVPLILEHQPSAVEMTSRFLLEMARRHPEFNPRLRRYVQGDPYAILIVEFAGAEEPALTAQAEKLVRWLRRDGYEGAVTHCRTLEEIANVWYVRRETNGLLMSQPGDTRPTAFVDDAAVPVPELADYALEVERVCLEAGADVYFDAHASAGCLHMNPAINLKTEAGLQRMETVSKAVMAIAIAHHGTTTGEHGEGLARSIYNEQLYGPRLHRAFRELKGLFDPHNRLNPGKIIDAPAPWEPELLRFNPEYRTPLAPAATYLDFSAHGGMAGLVEMCNGQGMCRARGAGMMCPSFRVTRAEEHSTRGRANALRAALTGQLGPEGLTSRELHEALDLCLECKGCKVECSSLVDMAKLKYEFLAHYQAAHGVPLRSRLFAYIATLNRLASWWPGLANWGYRNQPVRWLMEQTVGIARQRTMPVVAPYTFQNWFARHPAPASAPRGPVVLWDDTYLTYNNPEIGQAAVKVLEAAGFAVQLVADRRCCGRPMISKGLLAAARQNAAHNVARLAPLAARGIPIVGLEPSCIATFRDEYPDLLRSAEARQVAGASFFIEEFLADLTSEVGRNELELPFSPAQPARSILVHGHCYQKALSGTGPLLSLLRRVPGATVSEIPSGCCGMAGSFGYEREHYEVSMACGEERLFPAVRAAGPDALIAAAGISCRHQILDGTGRRAVHPIVILAEALEDGRIEDRGWRIEDGG